MSDASLVIGTPTPRRSDGMPVTDDTILRLLKLRASARGAMTTVRVAGIDD